MVWTLLFRIVCYLGPLLKDTFNPVCIFMCFFIRISPQYLKEIYNCYLTSVHISSIRIETHRRIRTGSKAKGIVQNNRLGPATGIIKYSF